MKSHRNLNRGILSLQIVFASDSMHEQGLVAGSQWGTVAFLSQVQHFRPVPRCAVLGGTMNIDAPRSLTLYEAGLVIVCLLSVTRLLQWDV